jgi:hypothetical protein
MSRTLAAAMLLTMIALAGCVPSLHPFYTNADLVLEPKLEGTWKEPDTTATWTITRAADKSAGAYTIVQNDAEGKRGEFIGHLAKVDGRLFMDITPAEPQIDRASDFYRMQLMPVHMIVAIEQVEPMLKATMLDVKWMKKHIEADPAAISHEIVDDNVVLTASTKELQQFFITHLATEGAYGEAMELTRAR